MIPALTIVLTVMGLVMEFVLIRLVQPVMTRIARVVILVVGTEHVIVLMVRTRETVIRIVLITMDQILLLNH